MQSLQNINKFTVLL